MTKEVPVTEGADREVQILYLRRLLAAMQTLIDTPFVSDISLHVLPNTRNFLVYLRVAKLDIERAIRTLREGLEVLGAEDGGEIP